MIYTTAKFLLSRLTTVELIKLMRDIEDELINRGWLGWCLAGKENKDEEN
jgi:predicted DNA-binding transcriptional regulator